MTTTFSTAFPFDSLLAMFGETVGYTAWGQNLVTTTGIISRDLKGPRNERGSFSVRGVKIKSSVASAPDVRDSITVGGTVYKVAVGGIQSLSGYVFFAVTTLPGAI